MFPGTHHKNNFSQFSSSEFPDGYEYQKILGDCSSLAEECFKEIEKLFATTSSQPVASSFKQFATFAQLLDVLSSVREGQQTAFFEELHSKLQHAMAKLILAYSEALLWASVFNEDFSKKHEIKPIISSVERLRELLASSIALPINTTQSRSIMSIQDILQCLGYAQYTLQVMGTEAKLCALKTTKKKLTEEGLIALPLSDKQEFDLEPIIAELLQTLHLTSQENQLKDGSDDHKGGASDYGVRLTSRLLQFNISKCFVPSGGIKEYQGKLQSFFKGYLRACYKQYVRPRYDLTGDVPDSLEYYIPPRLSTKDAKRTFLFEHNFIGHNLVHGARGSGKTSLAQYISFKWANDKYWSNFEWVFHIDLVRFRSLQDIPQDREVDFAEFLAEVCFPNSYDSNAKLVIKELFNAILSANDSILVIVDAFDFSAASTLTPMWHALSNWCRKKNVNLLFLAHTDSVSLVLESMGIDLSVVGIESFERRDRNHYVANFCSKQGISTVKELQDQVNQEGILALTSHPQHLRIICNAWKSDRWRCDNKKKVTSVVHCYLSTILRNSNDSSFVGVMNSPTVAQASVGSRISMQLVQVVKVLQEIAFNCFLRKSLRVSQSQLVAKSVEERRQIFSSGLVLAVGYHGVLDTSSDGELWEFSNVLIRNYLASRYLLDQLVVGEPKFLCEDDTSFIRASIRSSPDLYTLWPFMLGIVSLEYRNNKPSLQGTLQAQLIELLLMGEETGMLARATSVIASHKELKGMSTGVDLPEDAYKFIKQLLVDLISDNNLLELMWSDHNSALHKLVNVLKRSKHFCTHSITGALRDTLGSKNRTQKMVGTWIICNLLLEETNLLPLMDELIAIFAEVASEETTNNSLSLSHLCLNAMINNYHVSLRIMSQSNIRVPLPIILKALSQFDVITGKLWGSFLVKSFEEAFDASKIALIGKCDTLSLAHLKRIWAVVIRSSQQLSSSEYTAFFRVVATLCKKQFQQAYNLVETPLVQQHVTIRGHDFDSETLDLIAFLVNKTNLDFFNQYLHEHIEGSSEELINSLWCFEIIFLSVYLLQALTKRGAVEPRVQGSRFVVSASTGDSHQENYLFSKTFKSKSFSCSNMNKVRLLTRLATLTFTYQHLLTRERLLTVRETLVENSVNMHASLSVSMGTIDDQIAYLFACYRVIGYEGIVDRNYHTHVVQCIDTLLQQSQFFSLHSMSSLLYLVAQCGDGKDSKFKEGGVAFGMVRLLKAYLKHFSTQLASDMRLVEKFLDNSLRLLSQSEHLVVQLPYSEFINLCSKVEILWCALVSHVWEWIMVSNSGRRVPERLLGELENYLKKTDQALPPPHSLADSLVYSLFVCVKKSTHSHLPFQVLGKFNHANYLAKMNFTDVSPQQLHDILRATPVSELFSNWVEGESKFVTPSETQGSVSINKSLYLEHVGLGGNWVITLPLDTHARSPSPTPERKKLQDKSLRLLKFIVQIVAILQSQRVPDRLIVSIFPKIPPSVVADYSDCIENLHQWSAQLKQRESRSPEKNGSQDSRSFSGSNKASFISSFFLEPIFNYMREKELYELALRLEEAVDLANADDIRSLVDELRDSHGLSNDIANSVLHLTEAAADGLVESEIESLIIKLGNLGKFQQASELKKLQSNSHTIATLIDYVQSLLTEKILTLEDLSIPLRERIPKPKPWNKGELNDSVIDVVLDGLASERQFKAAKELNEMWQAYGDPASKEVKIKAWLSEKGFALKDSSRQSGDSGMGAQRSKHIETKQDSPSRLRRAKM